MKCIKCSGKISQSIYRVREKSHHSHDMWTNETDKIWVLLVITTVLAQFAFCKYAVGRIRAQCYIVLCQTMATDYNWVIKVFDTHAPGFWAYLRCRHSVGALKKNSVWSPSYSLPSICRLSESFIRFLAISFRSVNLLGCFNNPCRLP